MYTIPFCNRLSQHNRYKKQLLWESIIDSVAVNCVPVAVVNALLKLNWLSRWIDSDTLLKYVECADEGHHAVNPKPQWLMTCGPNPNYWYWPIQGHSCRCSRWSEHTSSGLLLSFDPVTFNQGIVTTLAYTNLIRIYRSQALLTYLLASLLIDPIDIPMPADIYNAGREW